jgi:hypothetical protein
MQKTLREYAQERLDIDVKASIETWPVADHDTAQKYNEQVAHVQGPTNSSFIMDWSCPGWTQWSKDCATIFAHDFSAQIQGGAFPLLRGQIGHDSIKNAFRDYIKYLKRRYTKESADPVHAAAEKAKADKRSRSVNRREQVRVVWSFVQLSTINSC